MLFSQPTKLTRERGALECRYYRFQMYPMVNEDGTFQYDDKGEIRMVNTKVRDRKDTERSRGKKWAVLNDYFNLVSRCPEQVHEYSWTDEEDKSWARAIKLSQFANVRSLVLLISLALCYGVAQVSKPEVKHEIKEEKMDEVITIDDSPTESEDEEEHVKNMPLSSHEREYSPSNKVSQMSKVASSMTLAGEEIEEEEGHEECSGNAVALLTSCAIHAR